jgi:hypothetical protein
MTLAVTCEILFPAHKGRAALNVRRWTSIVVNQSWRTLTNTAEVKLARTASERQAQQLRETFRAGDPVSIKMGVNNKPEEEFTGYILNVGMSMPMVLTMEDEMYQLKRRRVTVVKSDMKLKELLSTIAKGYEIECVDVEIGDVRYVNQTAAQILSDLKNIGIHSYFVGKKLVSNKYTNEKAGTVRQVVERAAGDSLQVKTVDTVKVVVKTWQKQGSVLKAEAGEDGGTVIELERQGLSYAAAKKLAEDSLKKAKQPGLTGTINLFAIPHVEVLGKMELKSGLFPEKNGTYYIDSIQKRASVEDMTYVQSVTLGDSTDN